jgi:hypothetical protein
MVAHCCIGIVAMVALAIAAALPGVLVQVGFAVLIVVPLLGAAVLEYRRRELPETGELVRLGAPRWVHTGRVERARPHTSFTSSVRRGP